MNLNPEQQMELNCFPAVLRALIELELAAGNSIVEIGHTFPAPPVGAYCKLANKVSARPRDSGAGVDFYERNNSSHCGEFTDEKRYFFVLEPPNPPPPDPDMDAIRKQLEAKPPAVKQPAPVRIKPLPQSQPEPAAKLASEPNAGLTCTETSTGVTRVLHFQDQRPPQEIKFALERNLMVLFTPVMKNGKLTMAAKPRPTGIDYEITLQFEAALPDRNFYSLHVATSWDGCPETQHDYYRKSAAGWFSFWTRNFTGAMPPAADAGSAAQYQKLCEAAPQAEVHLDTIPALQQAIVGAMKQGACFTTSDKEGETNIFWNDGRFVRVRSGDDPGSEIFANEDAFLARLRMFYDRETSSNIYPLKASEITAWKLIWRLLRTR
jgi:hypothetical protein